MQKGTLYIVATPIGNLEDISIRAVNVLKTVACVLSEDTRETAKLFSKYDIKTAQISYREQNHDKILGRILEMLNDGLELALVSDSGTPLISDPGFKLVEHLVLNGYKVVSIPGPTALVTALSVSGLPTDKFSFLGFLPKSKGARNKLLITYGQLDATLVIYESPFRVKALLKELLDTLGNRKCAVVSELTKLHETVRRGYIEELIEELSRTKIKGEHVVIVAKEGYGER